MDDAFTLLSDIGIRAEGERNLRIATLWVQCTEGLGPGETAAVPPAR
ncbi:hypothetical protein L1I79_15765 [Strepomyces sp. STD 3.1]|nr:hypothetical protein [Streptomyces sp. STD 3.1]